VVVDVSILLDFAVSSAPWGSYSRSAMIVLLLPSQCATSMWYSAMPSSLSPFKATSGLSINLTLNSLSLPRVSANHFASLPAASALSPSIAMRGPRGARFSRALGGAIFLRIASLASNGMLMMTSSTDWLTIDLAVAGAPFDAPVCRGGSWRERSGVM
jgi:hypothetical protein